MSIKNFKRRIPSIRKDATALIKEAVSFLVEIKENGLARNVSEFWFRLALDEAVENSMTHGNNNNPSKRISVLIIPDENSIRMAIEDEGSGFVPEDLPDPTDRDRFFKKHGRGVHILRAIADVGWNEQGNCITLIMEK